MAGTQVGLSVVSGDTTFRSSRVGVVQVQPVSEVTQVKKIIVLIEESTVMFRHHHSFNKHFKKIMKM